MSPARAQLDHIIILLPIDQLREPASWLTDNFTITPGGKHADGLTENILVILADGVYLEFIAFCEGTTPAQRAEHWWGKKPYGVVDYAFTFPGNDSEGHFDGVVNALKSKQAEGKWIPPKLIHGGRTRPDGVKIEWNVAFPYVEERGIPNFWCFDVTPRDRRVPISPTATNHQSGATGVASVSIYTDKDVVSKLNTFFGAFLEEKEPSIYPIDTPSSTLSSRVQVVDSKGDKAEIRVSLYTSGEKKQIKGLTGDTSIVIDLI